MTTTRLTADRFKACLNEPFALRGEDATIDLSLVEVADLGTPAHRDGNAFSLLFAGPAQPIMPQATYRLENPKTGALEIFLVPLGPSGDVVHYEAVFT